MEKIVTKIGDVTIERRVPKQPHQKFPNDSTVFNNLPQNSLRGRTDDLAKSYPEPESFQQDKYGVNVGLDNAGVETPMGRGLDLRTEMEQKLALPKGISWDYKTQENAQNQIGNWNKFVEGPGVKNLSKFDDNGSQPRMTSDVADMSHFGGISIERKIPEAYEMRSSGDNVTFSSGKPNYGESDMEQSKVRENTNVAGQSSVADFPYPRTEDLHSIKTFSSDNPYGQYKESLRNQRFPCKTFASKSPIQLSSDDEKPVGEDVQYDPKDVDTDEDFDSEDYDGEGETKPSGEKIKGGYGRMSMEKEFCDEESPIVLSSEDERNEEDILEVIDQSKLSDLNSQSAKCAEPVKEEDTFTDCLAMENDPNDRWSPNGRPKKHLKTELSETETVPDGIPDADADSDIHQDCKDEMDDNLNEMKKTIFDKGENSENDEETDIDDRISEKMKQDTDGDDETEGDLEKVENVKMEQDDEESGLKSSETELPASDSSEGDDKETGGDDVVKEEMSDIDLMELMKKGEIEGEVEDDKEYESDEDGTRKKAGSKRKVEEGEEEGEKDESKPKSKKKKSEKAEEGDGKEEDDKNIDKSKVTSANLRKNIREVMDETKLDEATLSAQRQEAERLKRLQDQQRIIRELQKQIVMNRQGQKSSNRVLSLLQGNSQTSILKTSSAATPPATTPSKSPNHVLVKLSNGQQTSLNNKKMIELLKNSKNKDTVTKPAIPKTLLKQGMVSPSVSIAPITKKEPPVDDKKKKKGDVVTLSSDSEDDCIVLSEEDESEPEEDPTNSGMHTSDKYNVPDDQGRVVVNVGHPEAEADIFLAPQIARIIKPHQIGGIRFLYDNVIESLERFQSSTGFGCILAHSMGLGKTLQIVSFSDIFLRYTSAKTILCIMPINTIQNWLAEFNMWLPKEGTTTPEVRCRDFDLYIVNESLKNIGSRSRVILDWHRNGGVLLMGYELFRLLSLKKSYKSKKKKKENVEEDEARNKELIEEVYGALVRPGPDLVICDEGHRIKNSHATTSQALKQIRTKRRIVLTGYPLQNNLLEYWCMVDFVRPNYLGSKTEFSNMFERPIQNGQCIDSTPQDKRLMRYRAHVLHSLLEGFVQRRSHAVLQSTLPEKEEYVLLLRFTPFQRKLYDTFMNEVVRTVAVPNPLKAFAVCCKIWNHPDVLYHFLKKKGEEIDLDLEEALPSSLQPSNYPFGQTPPDGMGQFPASPMGPPWPKRGPGSRGGKVRQCQGKGRPRGRKPAATVSPNLMPGCEKKDGDGFNNYPNYPDFQHQNSGDSAMEGDRMNRNFAGRGFNQFGSPEYGGHPNFTGPGYDSKNPLENLEDLSSGDFQNKRFYPQQGETGMQGNFPNSSCLQQNTNYPQAMNQSNNPDANSGFNANINRSDSRFNQSDSTKPFQYSQDYNSEFYHGSNFPPPQPNQDFEQNKMNFNRSNPPGDPYYQNSRYDNRENNLGYGVRPSNNSMDSGYHGYPNRIADQNFPDNVNKSYQNSSSSFSDSTCSSNPGMNYQNPMMEAQEKGIHNRTSYEPGDSNYHRNGFQDSGSNYPNNYRDSSNFGQPEAEREVTPGSNYQSSNFNRPGYPQDYWPGSNWGQCGYDGGKSGGDGSNEYMRKEKFGFESEKNDLKKVSDEDPDRKSFGVRVKSDIELEGGYGRSEDDKSGKDEGVQSKKEEEMKMEKKEEFKSPEVPAKKEDQNLPYDWATDLFKNYVTGIIENSSKMEVFFHILTETINLNDRLLVFSQSLLTLDLIEDYLHRRNVPNRDEKWAKNRNYFRLDGSTPGLEREKLINEFNSNPNVHIFLVSTRAGSLGINLVGANRVVVFDASWNPCHDTQAVCRVYRYGQQKPCFVYRLVMDSCLEKKIYDRQINKQGMADRVVDELNPDAHLSMKEVTNLCWDDQEDTTIKDFAHLKDKYKDQIIKVLLENCSKLLSKEPFQHESLLIDRKEKKLSQAEKRLAKRSYELEKQAANQPKNIYSFFPNAGGPRNFVKPVASVRPMQNEMASRFPPVPNRSKWIPAEVWQKQGMSAQEMTLPLDVVIPRNTPEKTSIVLKAGQRVMILKSPKGIYMQLENGKIIAIRTAFKVGQGAPGTPNTPNTTSLPAKGEDVKKDGSVVSSSLKNNPNVTITPKSSNSKVIPTNPFIRGPDKKLPMNITRSKPIMGKTKPLLLNRKFQSVTPEIRQRLLSGKPNFESQDEKSVPASSMLSSDEKDDIIVTKDMNESVPTVQDVAPEQRGMDESEKQNKGATTLDTLRKVTENINKDESKPEINSENMNQKNYMSNFSSQLKSKIQDSDEEKEVKVVNEVNNAAGKNAEESSGSFNGNENVQNWLMNQSYPPVDPYSNYFPSYYGYGHGAGSMVSPYEGLYPNNYSLGRTGSTPSKQDTQVDSSKTAPYQQSQPPNPPAQNTSSPRGSYPPYSSPYQYPYNYSNNPGYNNQGYPLTGQNQNSQQQQPSMTSNPATSANPTQNQPYDNPMYSAFHRPDGHFQGPESPYPAPYRPSYPNSSTPGFFPYNAPYRPYPDPNYHYSSNFSPYMHPPGYGYPMQNPSSINSNNAAAFSQHNAESATNSS